MHYGEWCRGSPVHAGSLSHPWPDLWVVPALGSRLRCRQCLHGLSGDEMCPEGEVPQALRQRGPRRAPTIPSRQARPWGRRWQQHCGPSRRLWTGTAWPSSAWASTGARTARPCCTSSTLLWRGTRPRGSAGPAWGRGEGVPRAPARAPGLFPAPLWGNKWIPEAQLTGTGWLPERSCDGWVSPQAIPGQAGEAAGALHPHRVPLPRNGAVHPGDRPEVRGREGRAGG